MHARRGIQLALGLLLTTVSCGDDDSPTETGGPVLAGTVEHMLWGTPLSGIAVGSGDVIGISGANGRFSLPGVEPPYDLLAVVPLVANGGTVFIGYDGATTPSPVLGGISPVWNVPTQRSDLARDYEQDAAELVGVLLGSDIAGETVSLSAGDGRFTASGVAVAAVGAYQDLWVRWPFAPTHTVDVAALQIDAGGQFRYGRVDSVVLARGTTDNQRNISLEPVAGGSATISVEALAPAGHAFNNPQWQAFVIVDDLPIRCERLDASSGDLRVPVLPDASYFVAFASTLAGTTAAAGAVYASFPGAEPGVPINFTSPEAGTLDSPQSGASDVPTSVSFGVTPPDGAVASQLNLYGTDPYGSSLSSWVILGAGDATALSAPRVPALHAGLNPASLYQGVVSWYFGTPPNAGELSRWEGVVRAPFLDLPLALAEPRIMVVSAGIAFETGD